MANNKYKKNSMSTATAAALAGQMHPKVWENMKLKIQYRWLTVGNLFKPTTGSNPTFTLVPFTEQTIFGKDITRLRVTIAAGTQLANWSNVVFDTCGTRSVSGLSLPKWVDNEATQDAYRRILRPTLNELKSKECTLERIEGHFERIEKDDNEVIRHVLVFRGIHLAKSVDDGAGNKTDLVVLMANDPGGGSAPDGGATGPPDG